MQEHLAVQQPFQIGVRKLADCKRKDRAESLGLAFHAHQILDRGGFLFQLAMIGALRFIIQQDDQVQRAQRREFQSGLIHEHAAAVDRWADRIGRDE